MPASNIIFVPIVLLFQLLLIFITVKRIKSNAAFYSKVFLGFAVSEVVLLVLSPVLGWLFLLVSGPFITIKISLLQILSGGITYPL